MILCKVCGSTLNNEVCSFCLSKSNYKFVNYVKLKEYKRTDGFIPIYDEGSLSIKGIFKDKIIVLKNFRR